MDPNAGGGTGEWSNSAIPKPNALNESQTASMKVKRLERKRAHPNKTLREAIEKTLGETQGWKTRIESLRL